MKLSMHSTMAAAMLGLLVAACSAGPSGQASPPPAAPRAVAAMPSNTICPVMGQAVDPSVPTSQYQGRTIGFCCPGCKPQFDANPAAYAGNIR